MRKILRLIIYYVPYPFFWILLKFNLIKNIRICKITSSRIGHLPSDIIGYLVHREKNLRINHLQSTGINYNLKKLRIIFFYDKIICNHQITEKMKGHIRIYNYNLFFRYIINFLIFWKENDFIFEINNYNIMNLPSSALNETKKYLTYNDLEKEKVKKFFNQIKFNQKNEWICFHNRDGEYLKKLKSGWPNQFNDWSYHDHRDFSIKSMEKAAVYFSENEYDIFRMGSIATEKFENSSDKIFDYVNSEYQNDFNDIFLLSNCKFYFGSDAGLNILPVIAGKAIYIININPGEIHSRTKENNLPFFIFKRAKYKNSDKLLSLTEFMGTNCCFSTNFFDYKNNNIELIPNSSLEILNFAKECLYHAQGNELNKEDVEIQEEFDNLYRKLFSSVRVQHDNKLGENKIKISPSFLKLNQDLLK